MQERFPDIFRRHPTTFSFEFFPPKNSEAEQRLHERAAELKGLRPTFVTCTYGAGGSTRARTADIVTWLGDHLECPAAAHLCCVGHTRDELIAVLQEFKVRGIRNIVALRGDAQQDTASSSAPDSLAHANQLVALIRERFGDHFGIAVAGYPEGHPQTPSKLADLDHLKRKVDAGADAVITQLFFENRDFYDFVERCEIAGIRVPIVAGIMPIVSRASILRMCDLCGSRIPAKLLRRLRSAGEGDDEAIAAIGIDWATRQCQDLLDNHARGIHFYVLNRSGATMEIYRRLGAADSAALARMAGA